MSHRFNLCALSALALVVPSCRVLDAVHIEPVGPADAPTTMYAPIPEPKTPCDEQRTEQPEPQGCYVPVPYGG